MKTIIITGAGGFVGAHTVRAALAKYEVIAIDSWAHRGDPARLAKIANAKNLHVITHDLTAPMPKRLIDLIAETKPDAIINVASESHVERSISDPVSFCQNNYNATIQTLELARKLQVKRFIQCSTDEVFGPALPDYASKEWDAIIPSNPYAASKAAQDALCCAYWRTYGLPMTITHTMNMIGEMQDPEKFVPLIISKLINNEVIKIHGTKEFIGSRYYLHAACLADAWLWLLEQPDAVAAPAYRDSATEIMRPEKFNIVGECEINNLELARNIAKLCNKSLRYEMIDFHSARPGHDRRYALDGSKIAALGWRHPWGLDESLARIVDFYTNPDNAYWLGEY